MRYNITVWSSWEHIFNKYVNQFKYISPYVGEGMGVWSGITIIIFSVENNNTKEPKKKRKKVTKINSFFFSLKIGNFLHLWSHSVHNNLTFKVQQTGVDMVWITYTSSIVNMKYLHVSENHLNPELPHWPQDCPLWRSKCLPGNLC